MHLLAEKRFYLALFYQLIVAILTGLWLVTNHIQYRGKEEIMKMSIFVRIFVFDPISRICDLVDLVELVQGMKCCGSPA